MKFYPVFLYKFRRITDFVARWPNCSSGTPPFFFFVLFAIAGVLDECFNEGDDVVPYWVLPQM